MQQRLPSLLPSPIGFAHRGASAHTRENTIESFVLAVGLGATGLESDVWLTRDGVAVLDHDGLVRNWPKKWIRDTEFADLPGHIPTVVELFQLAGNLQISLDIKEPRAMEEVHKLAQLHLVNPKNLWICHPSLNQVAIWCREFDAVRYLHSTRLHKLIDNPERHAANLMQLTIDGLNMHHTDWTGGLVTLFHRFGRVAFAWDLQHEMTLENLMRMGVDGVYSDWVDKMTDSLSANAHRPV